MGIKKLLGIAILLGAISVSYGQMSQIVEPRLSVYNPALAGAERLLSAQVMHQQLSVGFPRGPVEQNLAAHRLLDDSSVGVGLSLQNLQTGGRRRLYLGGQYAYWIQTGKLDISGGLEVGLLGFFQNWEDLQFRDPAASDPVFAETTNSRLALDASAGIYLRHPRYYGGLSVRHLFEPRIAPSGLPEQSNRLGRRFYGFVGARWNATQLRGYLETTLILTNMQFLSTLTQDSRQLSSTTAPLLTSLRIAYRFHPDLQVGGALRWSADHYGGSWDVIGDLGSVFVKWRFQKRFLLGTAAGFPLNNRRLTIRNKLEVLFGVLFPEQESEAPAPEDFYF